MGKKSKQNEQQDKVLPKVMEVVVMFASVKKSTHLRLVSWCVGLMVTSGAYAMPIMADSALLEEGGLVRLVATLEDSPAFTNVIWKVYRLDKSVAPVVIPRHTATLNLLPGSYRAVAILANVERSRAFQVRSGKSESVVIPLDTSKRFPDK